MAQFVKRINKMTGKNTALTKKNGVNMKHLQALANAAASITAAHPEIAEQISQPVLSANQNPNMRLNPPIEHLRRSPRLNNIQPDLRPMETANKVRVLIKKLQQQKQAPPRVQDTHTPALRVQGTPMSRETVPASRVPNTPSSDPKPKL